MAKEQNLQLREQMLIQQKQCTEVKTNNQKKPDANVPTNYDFDEKSFPPIKTEPPKPKPEPKWGEFKRPVQR